MVWVGTYHVVKVLGIFFAGAWVATAAYGSSQIRGWIRAAAAGLCHSHSNARSPTMTYITAHGNTGSLTHWVRPQWIEPASLWILVGFITTEPQWKRKENLFLLVNVGGRESKNLISSLMLLHGHTSPSMPYVFASAIIILVCRVVVRNKHMNVLVFWHSFIFNSSWFTIFYQFLLHSNMSQSFTYIHVHMCVCVCVCANLSLANFERMGRTVCQISSWTACMEGRGRLLDDLTEVIQWVQWISEKCLESQI